MTRNDIRIRLPPALARLEPLQMDERDAVARRLDEPQHQPGQRHRVRKRREVGALGDLDQPELGEELDALFREDFGPLSDDGFLEGDC